MTTPTVPQPGVLDWDFPRSVGSVALIVAFAEENGVTADDMLDGTGLQVADLRDSTTQIDARVELTVVRNLARHLAGYKALGLQLGSRYRLTTFGIFGYAMVSSPSLRDAIELALRYLELSFTFCIPVVAMGEDEVVATLRSERVPADVRQLLFERDMTAMFVVLTDLIGRKLPLRRIEFEFPRPLYAAEFFEIFRTEPRFDCAATLFTFDPVEFAQPLPQANEHTLAMCVAQCRDLVSRRRARTGIAHDVRERLIQLGGAPAGIDELARELNMSTRTLRRRLTEAGTSYRDLLDEVREALAEELLSGTPLSVSDVAIRLGYSEASTFIHAFKRWKGVTPAVFARQPSS